MGQAKKRGTFEERRQQSIERSKTEQFERARKREEWWNSLSEEEKKKIAKDRQAIAAWMGMAYSLGSGL